MTVFTLMLMAGDLALTAQGVLHAGPAVEANPIFRWVFQYVGWVAIGIWAIMGTAVYVGLVFWRPIPHLGIAATLAGMIGHGTAILEWLRLPRF